MCMACNKDGCIDGWVYTQSSIYEEQEDVSGVVLCRDSLS